MIWNSSTVPVRVEERHELSIDLGNAFAKAYRLHAMCEFTTQLLEMYKESRRMVDRQESHHGRYGSDEAYNATQGY